MTTVLPPDADWVSRLADETIAEAERRGTKVVVASGISPSGPVHLGNLREVMTPHLVADEIRRRGIECEHIISWDDFDRYRKVPNVDGVDSSWEEHIGKPLTRVPAPKGSSASSWAEHFRTKFEEGLAQLGVVYRGISQSEQYAAGAYTEQILFAMEQREKIDSILARYRTLPKDDGAQGGSGQGGSAEPAKPAKGGKKAPVLSEEEQAAADEAAAGSGAASEDDGTGASGYYPYKPYCTQCGTDFTTVTAYDVETTNLTYRCRCGFEETVVLRDFRNGKLVWKVDWPMRWAYEKVVFEPSGVDHQSPGSSFVVGKDVAPIFGWERPLGPMYAFVGIKGMAKMSSSKGGVPTPADALSIMEPALLRWLYARKKPNQSFTVAFDSDVQRMYDEWDALEAKVAADKGQPGDVAAYVRASTTAEKVLGGTPKPVAYRTLASVFDITAGDEAQLLRIVGGLDLDEAPTSLAQLRPRLTCVENWVNRYMPDEERTVVRAEKAADQLDAVSDSQREALRILLDGKDVDGGRGLGKIEDVWTLDGLTTQVYGVPKVQAGKDAHFRPDRKADPETAASLGASQREFFKLLYTLLIDKETGPRLPTLLLAVGPQKLRELLEA